MKILRESIDIRFVCVYNQPMKKIFTLAAAILCAFFVYSQELLAQSENSAESISDQKNEAVNAEIDAVSQKLEIPLR